MASRSDGPLFLVAVIRPRPECADDAEVHLRGLMACTRMEEGCEFMELATSDEDPHTWYMFEKFRSRADWEAHMTTRHVAEGNAALVGLLREPTELRFYPGK